jgi:large subunit ribosomal protein L21
MFAIVKIGGKQYTVKPKEVVEVARLDVKEGETLEIKEVLLVRDEAGVKVGKPFVAGAVVTAKVVGDTKGEKIAVRRYKHKVRYRKHTGFRAQLTALEILSVKHA